MLRDKGIFELVEATPRISMEELRDEAPVELEAVREFTLTDVEVSEPRDLAPGTSLADFVVGARIFISEDEVLSDDDRLLAIIEQAEVVDGQEMAPAPMESSLVTELVEEVSLSQYESGEFSVIIEATFSEIPPEAFELPLVLIGYGTTSADDMIRAML